MVAYVDEKLLQYPTIRHINCHAVIPVQHTRCPACSNYRTTLRVKLSRCQDVDRSDPSSRMNDRWRSAADLIGKMSRLRTMNRITNEKLQRAESKLSKMIESKGLEVRISYEW